MKKGESRYPKLDFRNIRTVSIHERFSKVRVDDFARVSYADNTLQAFLENLPNILVARDFKEFVSHYQQAIKQDKMILWMMGAHVVKVGLSPILIHLLRQGAIKHLAVNGAVVIHDVEVTMWGVTSEDVAASLQDGSFGMARETAAFINQALTEQKGNEKGYGEVIGEKLLAEAPNPQISLLATCVEHNIPVSVHPALGTEIVHQHPNLDGAAFGEKSLLDFQLFAHSVAQLEKGAIVVNAGSAVVMPEVFLKALTVVRNLKYPAFGFYTAVFDMIRHYRPTVNVMQRPTMGGGKGYYFIGHHEIMLPLLAALIVGQKKQ